MQPKALAPFTLFLANVSFILLETCALESHENQNIENRLVRKETLNMTAKLLKLLFII